MIIHCHTLVLDLVHLQETVHDCKYNWSVATQDHNQLASLMYNNTQKKHTSRKQQVNISYEVRIQATNNYSS